jgi:hypothetical protein
MFLERGSPLLSKEGWLRSNKMVPFLRGADGGGFDESRMRALPSSPRRGGCAIKKMSRSILSRADGVVINHENNMLDLDHHPVRSIKVASQHFSDVATTPPRGGGECSHSRFLKYVEALAKEGTVRIAEIRSRLHGAVRILSSPIFLLMNCRSYACENGSAES